MSSPPTISAFEFSSARRDSKDSTHSEPPASISQVTESSSHEHERPTGKFVHVHDDYDDFVPVNSTDGDGEKEAYARRLMEDLTWAFECR